MIKKYITDYSPETQLFVLNDLEEQVLLVMTKGQLEELIRLYKKCCEGYNEL